MSGKYLVTAQWDEMAEVWVATSQDISGLVTEAATLDDLLKRVVAVAPDLLIANGVVDLGAGTIDIHILSELDPTRSAAE
ncbi:MAG TPA: DUF1902 domain-containing protein [Devosia sp.]|nr:DUF1902 domain-containing protein [Devosia sp.]